MEINRIIRFASRMDQLPPYLFGMINKMGAMQFAIEIMDRANVAVAPGTGFSEEGEGFLRLALVENEERLRQAIRQIKKAMENMNV
jgi:alanine-synthesizing transaminase